MNESIDRHRALKIRRLKEERARIAQFSARNPELRDAEYDEWWQSVAHLLHELFTTASYAVRFQKLRIRAVVHNYVHGTQWGADPIGTWLSGLQQADKLLGEAIEEAELPVFEIPPPPTVLTDKSAIVVNVHNVFSPSVHITLNELLAELDRLSLTPSEIAVAREHLRELDAETNGEQRWPVIARSLESVKTLGKGIYEKVALPLLVEFLKRQIGP